MKTKSAPVLSVTFFLFTCLLPNTQAALLVNFGGTYLTSAEAQDLRVDEASHYFSLDNPIHPQANYGPLEGKNHIFYGGFQIISEPLITWQSATVSADNGFNSAGYQVLDMPAGTEITNALLFKKENFLVGEPDKAVSLDEFSSFVIMAHAGNNASLSKGFDLRIIVQQGESFYISEVVGQAQRSRPASLTDDNIPINFRDIATWYTYLPDQWGVEVGIRPFAYEGAFDDVQALGVYFKTGRDDPHNLRNYIARFQVYATVEGNEAQGRIVYVNGETGDDATGDPGDSTKPFKTINAAAQVAVSGDTVEIAGGTYRETVKPSLGGSLSGTITYRPAEGEEVVVSGADVIDTIWTVVPGTDGTVYETTWEWNFPTDMNQARQLLVNGEMMVEARHPNLGGNGLDPLSPAWFAFDSVSYNDLAGWSSRFTAIDLEIINPVNARGEPINPAGADIWYYARHTEGESWGFSHSGIVESLNPATGQIVYIAQDDTFRSYVGKGDQYHIGGLTSAGTVSGKIAMLDAPGEWLYDPGTKKTYLYPIDGTHPDDNLIEGKTRDYAFDLSTLSFITLQDLDIFAATVTTDVDAGNHGIGNGETWVGRYNETDRTTQWPQAHDIIIDGLNFKYVNHFDDTSGWEQGQWSQASGVIVSGMNMIIRNCVIEWSSGNGIMLLGNDMLCENNIVHSTNYSGFFCAAINCSHKWQQNNVRVMHNTVWRTGFDGIYSANVTSRDEQSEFGYNRIASFGLLTEDVGGLKEVGHSDVVNGTRWHHNIISDTNAYDIGLYLDFASEFLVDHNIVYEVARGHNVNDAHYHHIYNNTISSYNKIDKVIWGNPALPTYVKNNILIGAGKEENSNFVYEANLFWENMNQLVDPAGGDFSLVQGSVAIDLGVVIPDGPDPDGQGLDLTPVTIPEHIVGSAPDIGALEFGGTDWTSLVGSSLPLPWETPTDLNITQTAEGYAVLTWEDNADNETSYIVERTFERPNGDREYYELVAVLDPDTTTWTDTGSPSLGDRQLYYRVRADYSMYTNTVSIPAMKEGIRLTFDGDLLDSATGDNIQDEGQFWSADSQQEPTFSEDAAQGSHSIDFNPSNLSRVVVDDSVEISPRSEISIVFWINPRNMENFRTIFEKEGHYRLSNLFGSARLRLGTGGTTPLFEANQLVLNEWTHVGITYDGVNIRTYLNGELFNSAVTTPRAMESTGPLYIGGPASSGTDDPTRYYNGQIDDFIVSHRVLSQAEIEAMMLPSTGALTPGQWDLTALGYIYGYTPEWGSSTFMGYVYLAYPWIYQINFGWLYHYATLENGTAFWFYSPTLGWIYANIEHNGWFAYREETGWMWDDFINPLE